MSEPIKAWTPAPMNSCTCLLCHAELIAGVQHACPIETRIREIVRQELNYGMPYVAETVHDSIQNQSDAIKDAQDARRYRILRDCLTPRNIYDNLVASGKLISPWRDIRSNQTCRQKIDELCDGILP